MPPVKNKDGKTVSTQVDDLLEKAQRLSAQARTQGEQNADSSSALSDAVESIKSTSETIGAVGRFAHSSKETFLGVHERILGPLWSLISPPLKWVMASYKKLWNRHAFSTDAKTGARVLSRKRSSFIIALTIVVGSVFTPTSLGDAIRFVTVEPFIDGILMSLTKKTETFYLNNSEEVDHEGNVHAVRGCRHAGQCTEKDAAYFRVRPRLAHDIWKFVTYGNPIYVPDHVVAPIAPGVNKCEVTYYGYRMTSSWISRLIRSMQFYPTMLEASCIYIGPDH